MKLSRLLTSLAAHAVENFREKEVVAVECDSRRVRKGSVFVAVPGIDDDGAGYVTAALDAGAVAVVAQRPVSVPKNIPVIRVNDARDALSRLACYVNGCPSKKMHVIGITGTNGKTTTSYLVRAILEAAGEQTGLLGTVAYEYGDRVIPAGNTTPGPLELHQHLAQMLALGIEYAVLEVSSHALMQKRVQDIAFDAAIYTNLSHEHLDYHGTLDNYLQAKGILFEQLNTNAAAAINADDQGGQTLIDKTRANVISFGLEQGTIRAHIKSSTLAGANFEIVTPKGSFDIHWSLIGIHNIYNALAATACAYSFGFGADTIRRGLESVQAIPGRLERIDCGQPFTVLVDYAHTDDALNTVLGNLSQLEHNRILTVFGCGGDRDRAKRPKMGAAVERWSDFFWVTSDNPRSEDPAVIIQETLSGVTRTNRYAAEPDRRAAIDKAIASADANDIVLIAGKGHEAKQVLCDRVVPFDDRAVATESLLKLYGHSRSVATKPLGDNSS